MNPNTPKFLVYILWVLNILALGLLIFFLIWMFKSHPTEDAYVIHRSFENKVVSISRDFKMMEHNQFIPIKSPYEIGTEYYCTIELVDSSFIVDCTSKYSNRVHVITTMEYVAWQLIKISNDSDFKPSDDIYMDKINYVFNNETAQFPDTIKYLGLKIYDIEPWTIGE